MLQNYKNNITGQKCIHTTCAQYSNSFEVMIDLWEEQTEMTKKVILYIIAHKCLYNTSKYTNLKRISSLIIYVVKFELN